jgi:hypothetical protein
MKTFLSSFLLFIGFSGICQEGARRIPSNYGSIMNLPDELRKHIPEGFVAMDTLSGEVNSDHYKDLIMVLKETDEDTVTSRTTIRPLLIFTGQPDGSLKLAARNDKVVHCIECGGVMGDPYEGMATSEASFSVHMFGGSRWKWRREITFLYSSKHNDWFLLSDAHTTWDSLNPDDIEKTHSYGPIRFTDFDYEQGW